jgi:hypothetical protein
MKWNKILITLTAIIILAACQQKKEYQNPTTEEKTEKAYYNKERLLAHKAALVASVNNALTTSTAIEEKVITAKGFIIDSKIEKSITKTTSSILSVDSIAKTDYVNTTALLTVRVPDSILVHFINSVQQLCTQINTRHIQVNDYTIDFKEKTMEEKAMVNLPKKNTNDSNTEASFDLIRTKIDQLRMTDEIGFSTIEISLQQPEEMIHSTVINTATWQRDNYFFKTASYNLQKGFYYFKQFLLLLLEYWWVIFVYFFIKYLWRKITVLDFLKDQKKPIV